MRNRPLLSVCLIILCVLASCTLVGKERFIKELRPSPLEICTTEDESVIVCGVIYRQEQKENGQMIYLKHNSVYSISNKQKFQESKIIVYINSKEKLHIGNRIKVRGTVSFYENARNPGNFDQKFYYQKQGIHGKIYGSQMQITDKSVDVSGKSWQCSVPGGRNCWCGKWVNGKGESLLRYFLGKRVIWIRR